MQLLAPVFILLGLGYSWQWWTTALVFYFLYLCIGNNIGMHRYYCHKDFEVCKPLEIFIAWCSSMACLGSPLSYASIHVIHHRNYDTTLDPHGRKRGWRSLLFWFHKHLGPKDVVFTRNLSHLTKRYHLLHDYYWPFVFANALIMYLISWEVLLFCWLIPASLTTWAVSLVLLLQHDENGPNNSRSYMWFGWGETWHKNHHDNPGLKDHSMGKGIDWTWKICKILSKRNK